jgi:hypothetical protein
MEDCMRFGDRAGERKSAETVKYKGKEGLPESIV